MPRRSTQCRRQNKGTANRSRHATTPAQLGKGAGQGPRALGLHVEAQKRRMHKPTPNGAFMAETSKRSNERLTANDASTWL